MRVLVTGSTDFSDMDAVHAYVDSLPDGTTVIMGIAQGVEDVAAARARERGLYVARFPPDVARYGRDAVSVRNERLFDLAERTTFFWNGESDGTATLVDLACKRAKSFVIHSDKAVTA